jgi:ABC-type sugar transport system ATPase subunit
LIDGADVTAVEPQHRNVAMVFQSYALYPHKTVRHNIEFPLRNRRVPHDERTRRTDEAARLLGLSDLMNRRHGPGSAPAGGNARGDLPHPGQSFCSWIHQKSTNEPAACHPRSEF